MQERHREREIEIGKVALLEAIFTPPFGFFAMCSNDDERVNFNTQPVAETAEATLLYEHNAPSTSQPSRVSRGTELNVKEKPSMQKPPS